MPDKTDPTNQPDSEPKASAPESEPVEAGERDFTSRRRRTSHSGHQEAQVERNFLEKIWAKFLQAGRENYFEALGAWRDLRERVRQEVLSEDSRRNRGKTCPAHSPSKKHPKSISIPWARSLEEAGSDAEKSRSSDLRPRQGREFATRFRNVLVVGGMDFFGAALVRQMNAAGYEEITIADSLDNEVCRKLPTLKFHEFLSPEELRELASSRFGSTQTFSHIFYLGPWNLETMGLTKSFLNTVLKKEGRFVAISPASSIGKRPSAPGQDPPSFRPRTQSTLIPWLFDRYAMSNSAGESYLSLKHHQLFGPGEMVTGGLGGLVKSCHGQIRSTGSIRLPLAIQPGAPEGQRKFDFFSVQEAAKLSLKLAQEPITAGIYELGSGVAATPYDLVNAVIAATGGTGEIIWDESLSYNAPSPQPECALLGKLEELGWKVSFDDLASTLDHYVKTHLDPNLGSEEEYLESPDERVENPFGFRSAILPMKKPRSSNPE
jgi:ADP-L-glycero-D-manno-heptose 6-epimerase